MKTCIWEPFLLLICVGENFFANWDGCFWWRRWNLIVRPAREPRLAGKNIGHFWSYQPKYLAKLLKTEISTNYLICLATQPHFESTRPSRPAPSKKSLHALHETWLWVVNKPYVCILKLNRMMVLYKEKSDVSCRV